MFGWKENTLSGAVDMAIVTPWRRNLPKILEYIIFLTYLP